MLLLLLAPSPASPRRLQECIAPPPCGRGNADSCHMMRLAASQVRDTYERAVANVPPAQEKRFWQRYIYLWLNYALWEELAAHDADRAREVYRAALRLIPHRSFTFGKVGPLPPPPEPAAASAGLAPAGSAGQKSLSVHAWQDRAREVDRAALRLIPHRSFTFGKAGPRCPLQSGLQSVLLAGPSWLCTRSFPAALQLIPRRSFTFGRAGPRWPLRVGLQSSLLAGPRWLCRCSLSAHCLQARPAGTAQPAQYRASVELGLSGPCTGQLGKAC